MSERPVVKGAGDRQEARPIVLVVDDDLDIAESISDVLRTGGYQVEIAESGDGALAIAGRLTVAMVLLDWRLPNEPAGAARGRRLRDI